MKKILAIMLAVVMTFSMGVMAFAVENDCPNCDASFSDEAQYNAHIAICDSLTEKSEGPAFTIEEALEKIVEVIIGLMEKINAADVVITVIDFIEDALIDAIA